MPGLAALTADLALQAALTLLQAADELLLLSLLLLQAGALLLTQAQGLLLGLAGGLEPGALAGDLGLTAEDVFALQALVGGILADVAQAAVGLGEVVGREDEHQPLVDAALAVEILHGAVVAATALVEVALQALQTGLQGA